MAEASSKTHLSDLHVYPIKSCGGIAVDERGLRHDRRWMLVDETGGFISQRELPRMATRSTRLASSRKQHFVNYLPHYVAIPNYCV